MGSDLTPGRLTTSVGSVSYVEPRDLSSANPNLSASDLSGHHLQVAGTAGGVGTTTITALLAESLFARTGRPPRVADHSGGNLRRRLIATESNATYSIHDLGPHAWTVFGSVGEGSPIIVASPETAEATLTTLHHLATSTPNGKPGVIIINSTIPRRRSTPVVTKLARTWPTTVIIAIDWDAALAEPGPIDHTLVTTHTTRAITQVLEIVGV